MKTTVVDELYDPALDADRLEADPEVDELLRGAVDMHVHPGPSPFPRRIGIVQAARDAAEAGFDAIVVKSHHASMQTDILALADNGLADVDIQVHGGIALNHTVGGLNPYAVELVLSMGGKVVWFPTISSGAHIDHHRAHDNSRFPKAVIPLREHVPLSVLDDAGALRPEVSDIFDVLVQYGAVLNAGHLPADEIDVLVPAAASAGVTRIVVSHPTFIIGASPERCQSWVRSGAKVEHCLAMAVNRAESSLTQEVLDPYLRACGVENTVFSSDLGQANNILPVTGFRRMIRRVLDAGWDHDSVKSMVSDNAKALLDGGPAHA